MRRHVAHLLTALMVGLLAVGLSGGATAAAAPGGTSAYPPEVCPTIMVSTTVPQIGERIVIGGVNFLANRTITLVLKPVRNASLTKQVDLKTVRSDSQGNFTTTVALPDGATGTYDITARGGIPTATADGSICPADPSTQLTIADENHRRHNDNDNDKPAFTGFNMLWLLLLAAALIVVGIYATRRGRSGKDEVRSIHG